MHMSVSKRAASKRRYAAMVLAAAGGLGLILPATVSQATAIEPAAVEATATKHAPQDVLSTPSVSDQPGAMTGAEADPSHVVVREVSASGPVVSVQVLRALLADPAVRAHVGTAENAWDFTVPESIPGFGRLP